MVTEAQVQRQLKQSDLGTAGKLLSDYRSLGR